MQYREGSQSRNLNEPLENYIYNKYVEAIYFVNYMKISAVTVLTHFRSAEKKLKCILAFVVSYKLELNVFSVNFVFNEIRLMYFRYPFHKLLILIFSKIVDFTCS